MYGVFVGGLGQASEQTVREIFEQYGPIESVKIIREGVGQPKGYGFVNFCDSESQRRALEKKNELNVEGETWFVRKGHTSVGKDQVMNVQCSGFPEIWSKEEITVFVQKEVGVEVYACRMSQHNLKVIIALKRSDVQRAVLNLNDKKIDVDGRQYLIRIDSATPKNQRQQNITFATILYELALANGITPLLDQQQFYLLEKSLRTLYVGNIGPEVTDHEISGVFEDYGPLENVSLVMNNETGQHRGFAFVVFAKHSTCEEVLTADKFHSINGNIVKVQNSKPPKAVADLAKQAGLNDMEGHRTPLLEQMLTAASQQVDYMSYQQKTKIVGNTNVVQDPATGQCFAVVPNSATSQTPAFSKPQTVPVKIQPTPSVSMMPAMQPMQPQMLPQMYQNVMQPHAMFPGTAMMPGLVGNPLTAGLFPQNTAGFPSAGGIPMAMPGVVPAVAPWLAQIQQSQAKPSTTPPPIVQTPGALGAGTAMFAKQEPTSSLVPQFQAQPPQQQQMTPQQQQMLQQQLLQQQQQALLAQMARYQQPGATVNFATQPSFPNQQQAFTPTQTLPHIYQPNQLAGTRQRHMFQPY